MSPELFWLSFVIFFGTLFSEDTPTVNLLGISSFFYIVIYIIIGLFS